MIALCCSIAALVLGPLLLATGRGGQRFAATLDAFVVVVVVGVVFLHYVPHALLEAGPWVLLGMLLGLSVPYWAERASHGHGAWVRPIAFSAFALHAVLDGAALGGASVHAGQEAFVTALVVHRVAEGLAIQHLTRHAGRRAAVWALCGVVIATLLGYLMGERVASMGESRVFLFVQTLASGALLHVVLHGHTGAQRAPRFEALGSVVGLAVIVGLTLLDPELSDTARELSMGSTVFALALHMAPALLCATLLTLLLDHYARPRLSHARSPLERIALGLAVPPCATQVVAHVPAGAPRAGGAAAGITRVHAVSELAHPASLVVSAALLGPAFAVARWLAGFVCALVLPAREEQGPGPPRSAGASLQRALGSSAGFLVLGLLAGAWLEPVLAPEMFAQVPAALAIPAAALIGLPLHACAIGVSPLLVVLAHKQLDPGALLAFALTSSMVRVGSRDRPPLGHVAVGFAISVLAGFAVHALLPSMAALDLHAHAAEAINGIELTCLAVCAAGMVWLLFARGPRALVGPAWPLAAQPEHCPSREDCGSVQAAHEQPLACRP